MSLASSKVLALGAALFSANAAADFTALTFSDSIVDPETVIKARDYPVVGKSDVNVNKQFEDSCMAIGGLSLVVAVGLGAAALGDLKVPSKE